MTAKITEFEAVQAIRAKEKIAAAKKEVILALEEVGEGDSSWADRNAEVAADAIENLIRVIMEDKNG